MKAMLCFYHEELEEIEEMVNFLVLPRFLDVIHYKEVYYTVKEVVHDLDEGNIRVVVQLTEE
jgi:hypothetical protein